MKIVIKLLVVSLLSSSGLKQNQRLIEEYHSQANSLAEIRLGLKVDQSFDLFVRILETQTKSEEILEFSGTWTDDDENYKLLFGEDRPVLTAIFDKSFAEPNEFIIVNDSLLNLNKNAEAITMWGIKCDKTQR